MELLTERKAPVSRHGGLGVVRHLTQWFWTPRVRVPTIKVDSVWPLYDTFLEPLSTLCVISLSANTVRAHPDLRERDIDPASPWKDCLRIHSHV